MYSTCFNSIVIVYYLLTAVFEFCALLMESCRKDFISHKNLV